MGLIVSRSWFVTTNHHLFSWPLLTFDCFNFSCWIVSLTVVQNKIILFQEAPPGVYDMTILAYFLTILRYWTIFFDDITISSEKNDDTAILTKHRRYDDIDKKVDDIAILTKQKSGRYCDIVPWIDVSQSSVIIIHGYSIEKSLKALT